MPFGTSSSIVEKHSPIPLMKKHHILLILLLGGIAAFFLNETRNLKRRESIAHAERVMLRDAVKRPPGTATASTPAGKSSSPRPPAIEPAKFAAELADLLKGGAAGETGSGMEELGMKYQAQLEAAPVSKLQEICELLEKIFPLDPENAEIARQVWLTVLGHVAKSDPAWAITQFDHAASTGKVATDDALETFKEWATLHGETMSLPYAGALQKWLAAAQADGRIESSNPRVAELRNEIAAAQGNRSAAAQQISQLPYLKQRDAAIDHAGRLQTPEARRQAMEELSTALHHQNFPHFVRKLADQHGFDAARQILSSASLAPEKHDLAAASIAAANIGPDTPAKAKWLLESLRSEDTRAIIDFTSQWTHADYPAAAQWIGSLPEGRRREIAICGFAPVAARIDGATAVDWALTLTDPARRRSCLDDVVRQWQRTDPEAATACLREKGVTVK